MRILTGRVSSRFGVATRNLEHVSELIVARTGLASMVPGTLNVQLDGPYLVREDTSIEAHEYIHREKLKLQRCCVRGYRMFIMRPATHEVTGGVGADVLELISSLHLRSAWGLRDGDWLAVEVEGDDDWWEAAVPSLGSPPV